MINDVNTAITAAGYAWKEDSLEVMACGELFDNDTHLTIGQRPNTMTFKNTYEFKILGNLIIPSAHTLTAMYHRLDITEKKASGDITTSFEAKDANQPPN